MYDYLKYNFCGYFYTYLYVFGHSEEEQTLLYLIHSKTAEDRAGGSNHTCSPAPTLTSIDAPGSIKKGTWKKCFDSIYFVFMF